MELAFDNKVIKRHHIYAVCHNTLHAVSKRDYPRDEFFDTRIECLDMDKYESEQAKGEKGMTMDAAIGICKHENNKFVDSKILLVELRMGYRSPKNIHASELLQKVSHTKDLLGMDIDIMGLYLFVFRKNVIEQMKRRFKEEALEHNHFKVCWAISTEEFGNMVKAKEDYPYTPITDIDEMLQILRSKLSDNELEAFFESMEFWFDKADAFRMKYNMDEYHILINALKKIWRDYLSIPKTLSDDCVFYEQYMLDRYPVLKGL